MEKKMEATINGLYRDYHKDPFLHSRLMKGQLIIWVVRRSAGSHLGTLKGAHQKTLNPKSV